MRKRRTSRLGEFFTVQEFQAASSAKLTRRDRRALQTLVAVYLDPLRRQFGPCAVHSARRSRQRNAEVGGAPASYHVYTLRPGHAAADVSFRRGSPADWRAAAQRLGPTFVGDYPSHIHVDTRGLI